MKTQKVNQFNNSVPILFWAAEEKRDLKAMELLDNEVAPIYDPVKQISDFSMGGRSRTSCPRGTGGTKPKNEADQVIDD